MSIEIQVVTWIGDTETGSLRIIDQTQLPEKLEYRDCHTVQDVWNAIKVLKVRGAPAIGVAAAYAMVMSAQLATEQELLATLQKDYVYLRTCRPTAVNLEWALNKMLAAVKSLPQNGSQEQMVDLLLKKAHEISRDNDEHCYAIGMYGESLIHHGMGILTHCNAGSLATSSYGTATAPMYFAHQKKTKFHVYVDETRPLLQGARLTAWELIRLGIPCTLICDNMAAQVMREGKIQMVIVGADRIARNGDTANKIGTYGLAVLAKAHDIAFYVAAPHTTFDNDTVDGDQIVIEHRLPEEVSHSFGRQTAPNGVNVYNPAFDVTPVRYITGFITDKGILKPPISGALGNPEYRKGQS